MLFRCHRGGGSGGGVACVRALLSGVKVFGFFFAFLGWLV